MTTFKIGEKIRSYDFVSRDYCYIEGIITSIDNGVIQFRVTKAISEGEEHTNCPYVMSTSDLGKDWTDSIYEDLGRPRIQSI